MAQKTYEMTAVEVARALGCSTYTVRELAKAGRMPGRKNASGRWRFSKKDLEYGTLKAALGGGSVTE